MTVAGTGAQLTLRAAATGMALGAVLSLCNIYSGLRIGWGFNMSITAALVAYVGWQAAHRAVGSRPFGMLENNISQMCASAAASISSAGLVAAIPALALVTGKTLPWHALALWTFSVSAVGVAVAIGLRQSMVGDPTLPFPSGIATAETLREIYAHGREAAQRVWALAIATALAAAVKLVAAVLEIPALALPAASRSLHRARSQRAASRA